MGSGDVTYRTLLILHTARSKSAGVVRADDVESGKVCFACVYPFPTAREQNALTSRLLAGFFADSRLAADLRRHVHAEVADDDLRALGEIVLVE